MNLFSPDSRLMKLLTLLGQLMVLNILWLLCCLPVLTIGPSTTALYVLLRRIIRGEPPRLLTDFFRAFRENFLKGFLLNLILLLPMLQMLYFFFMMRTGQIVSGGPLRVFSWIAIVIIGMVWSYVWPLNAWFENSVSQTLKNALLLPVSSPIAGLLVTGLNLCPLIVLYMSLEAYFGLMYFWLTLGGALIAFFNTRLLLAQFRPFMPQDEEQ